MERQRLLAHLCYEEIAKIPGVRVLITKHRNEPKVEPSCYGLLPIETPEGYEYLPDKTMELLNYLSENYRFDHVLKCDDDIVLDPSVIRRMVSSGISEDYFGIETRVLPVKDKVLTYHQGKCKSAYLNANGLDLTWAPEGFAFMSGTCYGLSLKAVQLAIQTYHSSGFKIQTARENLDIRGVGAEDVLLSFLLQSVGLKGVESIRALHCPKRSVMFSSLLREIKGRLTGKKMLRCIGVVTSNRMARPDEQLMLRLWQLISKWLG